MFAWLRASVSVGAEGLVECCSDLVDCGFVGQAPPDVLDALAFVLEVQAVLEVVLLFGLTARVGVGLGESSSTPQSIQDGKLTFVSTALYTVTTGCSG